MTNQPTEKWTLKNKTDLNSIYVWGFPSIGYKVQTVNNLLIEQLQSEAFSKGQFEALKASQIRIYLDKKIEEARADEKKKLKEQIESAWNYGRDRIFESMDEGQSDSVTKKRVLQFGVQLDKIGLEQPVESKEEKNEPNSM